MKTISIDKKYVNVIIWLILVALSVIFSEGSVLVTPLILKRLKNIDGQYLHKKLILMF